MSLKYYSRNPETAREVLQAVQNEMNKSFETVVNRGYEDVKEACLGFYYA